MVEIQASLATHEEAVTSLDDHTQVVVQSLVRIHVPWIKWAQTLMLHRSDSCGVKELSRSRYLRRVGRELDTVAAGVVNIHGVARPIAVHTDVLYLDARSEEH